MPPYAPCHHAWCTARGLRLIYIMLVAARALTDRIACVLVCCLQLRRSHLPTAARLAGTPAAAWPGLTQLRTSSIIVMTPAWTALQLNKEQRCLPLGTHGELASRAVPYRGYQKWGLWRGGGGGSVEKGASTTGSQLKGHQHRLAEVAFVMSSWIAVAPPNSAGLQAGSRTPLLSRALTHCIGILGMREGVFGLLSQLIHMHSLIQHQSVSRSGASSRLY